MHNWKTVLEVLFYLGCHIFIENAESAVIENAESAGTENTESAGCQPADIIFVLDSSGSIGASDFQIEKDFVKNTVDHWDIHPDKTRVGMIVFSSYAWMEFPLNKYSDKESLQSAILDAKYIGGDTHTSAALELMLRTGFSTTNGARRGGIQMGIVITDGWSNDLAKTATSAANVHMQRIFMFAIGVGTNLNYDELNGIGSDPDNDFVFLVHDFEALSHIQDVIGQKACDGWQLVNVTVNEALKHDTSLVFRCEFVPKPDKFYTVTWYVDGVEKMKTESLNESNMADHYLHEDAISGPGVEISCDVTSGTAETGAMSLIGRSMELFIGIIVTNPVVNLERTGETTKQVNMTTQVPIRCRPDVSVCSFRLVQLQYSGEVCGGWDMGLSQRCQQTIDGSDVNQNITFDISIKDPAGYNLGKTEKILQLEIPSIDPDVNSLWHSYRLTDIRVQYTDGSNIWKGKECYAIVDPHFLNFDGMQFDCHLSGEFVMYKHSTMPLEIQIKTRSCLGDGASPYCICAVAVQAGRDVFIMDFCNRPPIVQVVSCDDNVLNIREVTSDGSYKIFLPTGTMVNVYKFRWSTTVIYLNVKIVPSAKDVGKTNGLCGILNGNDLDDFCVRDSGECETVQNSWDEPKKFCNSSRASDDENLFEMDSNKMKNLPPWEKSAILCMCPFAKIENNTIPGPGEADQFDCSNKAYNECDLDQLEQLKPTKFKCSIITSPQRKRREALRRQKRYTRLTSRRKRSEEETTNATISQNLTEEDAINLCTSNLKGSPLHEPCSSSIGINVNPSINNCVLDIMLTGTTAWTDAALESYSRSCINQVDMNNVVPLDGIATTTESHESSNDPRYIVYQLFCPYKCNGHGTCINGSCVCEEGFGNGDCSIDITEPPLTDDILNDGLCDTFDTDCTEVSIYGENYIDSANLTCHIKTYEITPTGEKLNENVVERAGEYISPYEVSCGLPDFATGEEEDYVTGYSIAISNKDGIYGEEMPMYVYNSECIKPTSTGDMEYAFSKTGQCCYIDKHHHIIEDLNQCNASQICDPGRSFVDWSDKLVCQDWQYGFNCQQSCSCNRKNAMNCSDADGSCLCKEGWNGTNCEVDVDECLDDPCPDTTTCLNTDGSFSCSCGVGKVLQDNAIICVDCIEGTHGLDCQEPCQCIANHTDICSIINGSCACKTGWEGDSCEIDIDECLTAKCMNHAKCINLNGSHECQCFPGYRKDGDSCQGCLPGSYGIDCQGVCNCSNKHTDECSTIDGTCLCEEGWAGELCEDDIDECLSNSCPSHSNCDNNIGSYTCLCHAGYQKTNGQCDGCLPGSYGIDCQGVCNCSNKHTDECSTIDGTCLCEEGWAGELCEDDIDECLSNSCPSHSKCINNIGSYTCLCHAGYQKTNEQCDGCLPGSYGIDCQGVCNCSNKHTDECSTIDGTCLCEEGWAGELCEDDIDECLSNSCPSHSKCINNIGSYTCLCHAGYQKTNEQCDGCLPGSYGIDCQGVCNCSNKHTDECSTIDGTCLCEEGWAGELCEDDIDECLSNSCPSHSKCINNIGSYTCLCHAGYQKTNEQCDGCLPGSYGIDCQGVCNCSNKHTDECSTIDGTCLCEEGWAGELCEDDIDECLSNSCPSHSKCINNIGSYTCLCHAGYQKTNEQCDGCLTGSYGIDCQGVCNCSNQHTDECSTIDGTCLCEEGWSGELCEDDIDECLSNSCPFHSKCINNIGSYTCLCHAGYKKNNEQCDGCLTGSYGIDCQGVCNCSNQHTDECSTIDGTCLCEEGWSGELCEDDIDECLSNSCPFHSKCINTIGSYTCMCHAGYTKNNEQCDGCLPGSYGIDCQGVCNCSNQHTDECSTIDGTCLCEEGWSGELCEDDIDECLSNSCPFHSKCINNIGSYTCLCHAGYQKTNEQCDGCLTGSYGIDCQGVCNCSNQHTDECSTIDGTCLCEEGWSGELCEDDIDECLSNSCPFHSKCINTIGSYTCMCHAGYTKNNEQCDGCLPGSYGIDCQGVCNCSNKHTDECSTIDGTCLCEEGWAGELCEDDIDECLSNSCPSHSNCDNNIGSYTCLCHAGYQKTNGQCDGCSPGYYGIDCQDVCNCSKKHTDECSTTNGTCFCDEGWGGELCEDDIDECLGHHCPSHSDCHQEIGSYTCLCHDGYRKINGQCKEVEQFKAQTILDLDIFTSPDNPNYPMLITKTESAFYQYFEDKLEDTLVDVHVTGVRSGSLITDYDVFTQTNVSSAFSRSVISLVSGDGRLMYDGSLVSVISTAVFTENGKVTSSKDSHDVCTLYTHLNQCPQDFSCEIDSQAYPSCKERFPEGSFPLYLILGFAIGVPVMLVVLWIVFFVVCKRKTTRKNGGRNSNTIAKGTRHLSIVNESCQHGAVNDRQIEYNIYSPSANNAPLYYPTRNKSNRFGAVNRNYSQNWDDLNDYSW